MKKFKNIKVQSNTTHIVETPVRVVKHRVVKTDPTYKFVIKSKIHVTPTAALRVNGKFEKYHDLQNISAPRASKNFAGWISAVENVLGISLTLGGDYPSNYLQPLFFVEEADRDLFDAIYLDIKNTEFSEGVSNYVDFSLYPSRGFVRNKLALNNVRESFFTEGLSLNVLSIISSKPSSLSNFSIESKFIDLYDYNADERFLLSELFKYNSTTMPKYEYNPSLSVNYFWDLLNRYQALSSAGRLSLFGFSVDFLQADSIYNAQNFISYNTNNLPNEGKEQNYKKNVKFVDSEEMRKLGREKFISDRYKQSNTYFKR